MSKSQFSKIANCQRCAYLKIAALGLLGIYLVFGTGYYCEAATFSDLPLTHPQYQAINCLYENNVLSGYEDGTFKPERTVTRAEMVKLALKGAGIELENQEGKNTFSDVQAGDWFAPYVEQAVSLGVVRGFDDGTFGPDKSVKRVEALKMIIIAQDLELPLAKEQIYTDVEVDAWYAPYVRFVYEHQLLTIEGDEFGRDEGMRRKDIAEVLYKLQVNKDASNLNCWPFIALSFILFLWIILAYLNIIQLRRMSPKYPLLHWLMAIILAPLMIVYYTIYNFDIKNLILSDQNTYRPSKHERLNYLFRNYVYIRRSREVKGLVTLFLKRNYQKLLYLSFVLLLNYFIFILILTGLVTCSYKNSFFLF